MSNKSGSELFFVDNSDSDWKVLRYLREWCQISKSMGIATKRKSHFPLGVPAIGSGYQVCEKWLKDRKGRTLTDDDITHYHKIIIALSETIRLMSEIDIVITTHGGWPGAFAERTAMEAADGGLK